MDIRIFALPFDVDSFDVKMYSDKRCDKRDATKWLNAKLQALRNRSVQGSVAANYYYDEYEEW
jgi:hypothetical protein